MPERHRFPRGRKGWRKPAGSVVVHRGSKWGNPYKIGSNLTREEAVELFERDLLAGTLVNKFGHLTLEMVREQLPGKDLVCFCGTGELCHADVLLRVANEEADRAGR